MKERAHYMKDMLWGWRLCKLDLTSRDGYQWPLPGQWVEAPDDGRSLDVTGHACPSSRHGGLCIAKNTHGAASGGRVIGKSVCLLVGYLPDDVLGEDEQKVRVRRAYVGQMLDAVGILTGPGANLYGANLYRADFRNANLRNADLRYACLTSADFRGADLRGADFRGADLSDADFRGADLRGADLRYAYLTDADLRGANLWSADLYRANLGDAILRYADLRGANFIGADLRGTYLRDADLRYADLRYAVASAATVWPKGFDPAKAGVVMA